MEKGGHELDLIQRCAEEEKAEFCEAAISEVSPAVEVIPAFLIGGAESGEVLVALAGESAGKGPETETVDVGANDPGVRIEACDAAIAIAERMNPGESMVRGGEGDQLVGRVFLFIRIGLGKSIQHLRQDTVMRRLVGANFYFE